MQDEHSVRRDLQSKGTFRKQKAAKGTQFQSKRRRKRTKAMYLCVRDINIVSFCDFDIGF